MKIKYFYTIILLAIFFFIIETANAQTPDWEWAKGINNTETSNILSEALDDFNNLYITGMFYGTVDFDPGLGVFNLTSAGSFDIFISKYDNNGNFIWAKSIGGTGMDWGRTIKIDVSGNIYVAGYFNDTVDFNLASDTFSLTYIGSNNGKFIAKYDSSFNFLWAKPIEEFTNSYWHRFFSIDNLGNVYLIGSYTGNIDIDPDTSIVNLSSNGSSDIYIYKLNSAGNFIWAKSIGSAHDDVGYSIDVDLSGNLYTTGAFSGTVDFDPNAGVFNLNSSGLFDAEIFVSKFDNSGNFIWAKSMGGVDDEWGKEIHIDADQNVYCSTYFNGIADFDPGLLTYNLSDSDGHDVISKLDNMGNFVWAKQFSGLISLTFYVDAIGDVYNSGSFGINNSGGFDFDPGTAVFILTSTGGEEIFISKLKNTGDFLWAKAVQGNSADRVETINLDGTGKIYLSGYYYSSSLMFNSQNIIYADSAANGYHLFISKLDNTISEGRNIDNNNSSAISLYPNPATDILTITSTTTVTAALSIIDLLGRKIYTENVYDGITTINLKTFASGIYLLYYIDSKNQQVKKFVVQK